MSLDLIFPDSPISQTEIDILKSKLSDEDIKKHLRRMALKDIKELLALSALDTSTETLITAHATVQGRLQVVNTLLSIGELSIPSSNSTN